MLLKAPENCDHIHVEGDRVEIPEDGLLDCTGASAEVISNLMTHGFLPVPESDADGSESQSAEQSASDAKPPTQTQSAPIKAQQNQPQRNNKR
jgi:hypothetical protein